MTGPESLGRAKQKRQPGAPHPSRGGVHGKDLREIRDPSCHIRSFIAQTRHNTAGRVLGNLLSLHLPRLPTRE